MSTATLLNRCPQVTAQPMHANARRHFVNLVCGESRGLRAAVLRFGLRLAAFPYGMAVRLRNSFYDFGWLRPHTTTVPVISVGNLTVGGTGKTPCVEYIANYFREREARVAILSRGYGVESGPNDEALMLEENLPDVPHLQGRDRVALARTAVEELESEILLLDDGFQHRRLARDLDLVLIDATCPWGHGYLLPRGLLREPANALRRAQAVVLTRCDQVELAARADLIRRFRKIAPNTAVVETSHEPVALQNAAGEIVPLDHLQGKPVAAFCGIGNPGAFEQTVVDLGGELKNFKAFPDHHPYTRHDVEVLESWVRPLDPDTIVVTTQKDLVKLGLNRLGRQPLYAVRVQLRIDAGREELHRLLDLAVICERPTRL